MSFLNIILDRFMLFFSIIHVIDFYFLMKYVIFELNITIFHVIFSCHYKYFVTIFLLIHELNEES